MDSQVENAVSIALDPSSCQELKGQAINFLNQLRCNASGQQACVALFTRIPKCSDVVRVVSLDIIINAIKSEQIDIQFLIQLRETLLEYVKIVYGSGDQDMVDPIALQNKLTQTLTFIFTVTYKHGWDSFFHDFLALTNFQNDNTRNNPVGTELYLRILSSIHDEIADVIVTRTNDEARRNTELKDAIRAHDVSKIVASWLKILSNWHGQSQALIEMCLKVMGKWSSWIDISLIMNYDLLNIIFQFIGRTNPSKAEERVRDVAIDTLSEIVAKKMKAPDKIEMIIFLNLGEVISQLIASPPLNDFRATSNYDTDLAETVAKLVDNVVSDIVMVLEGPQTQAEVRVEAEKLIQKFLPLLLRFFSDEYDEISCTVIPSLTNLLAFLRKVKPLPAIYSAMLTPILNSIIQKIKYDETYSWGKEDEKTDEADFQELRKRLQVLQKGVVAVDQSLYIEIISNLVGNIFQSFEQHNGHMNWRDVDLALHEMFLFGELTLNNSSLYAKSLPTSLAAERLIVMISKMIDSGIASFTHPAIQLQYMEICVRYCSFFEIQTHYIPRVLEDFVRLVHHNHIRVRSRSWYLFYRFSKHLRTHIGNIAGKVLQSISDLLPVVAEVPKELAADNMSSEEGDQSGDATFSSQLYLFEAMGSILSTPVISVDRKALHIRTITDPLFLEIEKTIGMAKTGNYQATLQIHHVIMALGSFSHGFADWAPATLSVANLVAPKEITEEFRRVAEANFIALETLKSSRNIRTAARASLSRLLGVLGVDMLPLLPRWIGSLLSENSTKDETAMFLHLLDQVIFGFNRDIYGVLDSLLSPLLQRVFAELAEPTTGTDDEIQLAELRREYLTFIQVILNNELGSVLVSDTNRGYFEQVILSVTSLASTVTNDTSNLNTSRLAFSNLTLMTQFWGGPNIASVGYQSTVPESNSQPTLPDFDRLSIERFHPVCWNVLLKPSFKPAKDAQCKQILTEIAGLEQAIYKKTGDVFIRHLEQEFFPAIGFEGNDFIKALKTSSDRRIFARRIQELFNQK